jgi:hypothetical protein
MGRVTDMDYTNCEGFLQVQHASQERDKVTINGDERCENHCLSIREGHCQVQRMQIIRSFR